MISNKKRCLAGFLSLAMVGSIIWGDGAFFTNKDSNWIRTVQAETTQNSSETTTMADVTTTPGATTAAESTTEQVKRDQPFGIEKISYDKNVVQPGDTVTVTVTPTAMSNLEEIDENCVVLTYECKSDVATIYCELDEATNTFVGTCPIKKGMANGEYIPSKFEYTNVLTKEAITCDISESGYASFVKWEKDETVAVSGIKLSKTSLSMRKDASEKVNATIYPTNATNQKLSWKSNKTSVATVSQDGTITAIKAGSAIITATATDGSGKYATVKVTVSKNFIIVIDPGHGGSDCGAVSHRVYERNVNLRMAIAMRNELEKYSGVTVFLTRQKNSKYVGLEERSIIAARGDADLFISLHNNAGSRSVKGSEIYVTRNKTKSRYNKAMTSLGKKILTQMGKQGFRKRGVFTRTSSNQRYKDGTRADYYAVIRHSIERDIPALLIEHGYLTNSSDRKKLKSASKAKKIGVADAKAVVNYLGLKKSAKKNKKVTGILLSKTGTKKIKKGKGYTVNATVAPSCASNKGVTYSSSNSSIATVSSNGYIKGKKKGTAMITVKAKDGTGVTKKLKVKIY